MNSRKAAALITALILSSSIALTACSGKNDDTAPADTAAQTESVQDADSTSDETDAAPDAAADDGAAKNTDTHEELKEMTALEVSKLMGNGINLGNTMEAYGHNNYVNSGTDPTTFENAWGQPTTTREMIDGMKAAGFDTIRIPVAWTNGMKYEENDFTIDKRLMDRVQTIVDYAIDADMYVIINDHWDGSWWGMFGSADEATRDKALDLYKAMWTQIADRFGDYSYKLIFESANEELGDRLNDKDVAPDSGTLKSSQCYETANMINSEFVKLIRSTGGRNADRFLLIAGYNTDIEKTCNDRYVMPEDTAEGKLFVSVHYYTPWDYCGTDAVNQWGSPKNYEQQNTLLESMTKFTDKGYGVIIGEYAVMSSKGGQKPDSDKFYNNFLDNCDYYNYVPMLWDCNDLYKRLECKIKDQTFADIYSNRRRANEPEDYAEVQAAAKANMDKAAEEATEKMMENVSLPASDDMAIAWIMYNSADYGVAYSVGDTYDPTNMTNGIKAENVQITGDGTYTVSLDLSDVGAKGVAFSALGISNGETFFPGCTVTIDKLEINGEERELAGKEYTTSDNSVTTRVNLYNQWVNSVPAEARTADGNMDDLSATIMEIGAKEKVKSISITFTFKE